MKTMEQEFNEKYNALLEENTNLKLELVQEQAEREAVELSQFLLETTLIEKGVI